MTSLAQAAGTGTSVQLAAAPTGVAATDTAAIQAAITALGANGGTIHLQAGEYVVTTLDLSSTRSVTLQGQGGRTNGAVGATKIVTNATGTGSVINGQNSAGLRIADLQVINNDGAFTGRLIDLRNVSGSDTAGAVIENCTIGGAGVHTAVGVDLDKCISSTIRNCSFVGCAIAIRGKSAAGTYSNAIEIDTCAFSSCGTVGVRNPGEGWRITGCTFEPLAGGSVAGAIDHTALVLTNGLFITGNWFGDTTSGTTILVAGKAICVMGNYIGCTTGTGVKMDEVSAGFVIVGNEFVSATLAIDVLGSGSNTSIVILGNRFSACAAAYSPGNIASGAILHDDTAGGVSLSGASINGDLVMIDGNNITCGASTGSKIGGTGSKIGFYGHAPVALQTGVAVTAAGIHAALVSLGLITA